MSADDDAFLEWLERIHSEDKAASLSDARDTLLSQTHSKQHAFITDPHRFKDLFAPRRTGKTGCFSRYMLVDGLSGPDRLVRYVTDTRSHAKDLMWEELHNLLRSIGVPYRSNSTELLITLPNGSRLFLGGAETEADINKYRGFRHNLFIIDEAGSNFRIHILKDLVSKIVMPSLVDVRGTLCLGGTPGEVPAGLFYDLTGPKAEENGSLLFPDPSGPWSRHVWELEDNTFVPHLREEMLALKARMGWSDQHPTWLREAMCRWASDDDKYVYKLDPERDLWAPEGDPVKSLPVGHQWRLLMGVDMGFVDPTAVVLFAYSNTHPIMYQVYEHSEAGLHPPAIAALLKRVQEAFGEQNIDAMIADFSGYGLHGDVMKQQLLLEYGLLVEQAEQKDKRDHVELFNGDLVDGRLKLLAGSKLVSEMLLLCWDDTMRKERSGLSNHLCDAAVYIWRLSQHRFARSPLVAPVYGSEAWEKERSSEEDRLAEEYARRHERFKDDNYEPGFDQGW